MRGEDVESEEVDVDDEDDCDEDEEERDEGAGDGRVGRGTLRLLHGQEVGKLLQLGQLLCDQLGREAGERQEMRGYFGHQRFFFRR